MRGCVQRSRRSSLRSMCCFGNSKRGSRWEAKHGIKKPLLIHAILETALGVSNVEEVAAASPRMQGISLGPADLAASSRGRSAAVRGGGPAGQVIAGPDPGG